jgi:hypothetical protein
MTGGIVESPAAPQRFVELTILGQDPSVYDVDPKDGAHRILRAKAQIPLQMVEPGPWGPRFHVVDYSTVDRTLEPAFDFDLSGPGEPRDLFDEAADEELLTDRRFHAQNVFAIASRTLAAFEFALGRRIPWSFDSHQLYLVPHAFREPNAFYADAEQALLFGDVVASGRMVSTCLSHDIVAHETTHAILDGLRERFDVPGLPDQAAFHEGFADVVALLSVFGLPEVVGRLIADRPGGTLRETDVEPERLRDLSLVKLAEEFGDAMHDERGQGLRNSATLPTTEDWKDLTRAEWLEPHRRGEILVAAVMHALIELWSGRLKTLVQNKELNRDRAAEDGAKVAEHLLNMMIRAIDYCPPVEFEFADFLDAALIADQEVVPEDRYHYREAVVRGFGAFGIRPRRWPLPDVGTPDTYTYRGFNYLALRSDREEVYRFIWQNAETLGIPRTTYLKVESVVPSVRISPDGFVVTETVVEYVQQLGTTMAELRDMAPKEFAPLADVRADRPVKVWGGGTIIFDQFGRVKHHLLKPLDDWRRQADRLAYLIRQDIRDREGRFGYSLGLPGGMRFAVYHQPRASIGESW